MVPKCIYELVKMDGCHVQWLGRIFRFATIQHPIVVHYLKPLLLSTQSNVTKRNGQWRTQNNSKVIIVVRFARYSKPLCKTSRSRLCANWGLYSPEISLGVCKWRSKWTEGRALFSENRTMARSLSLIAGNKRHSKLLECDQYTLWTYSWDQQLYRYLQCTYTFHAEQNG